MGWVTSIVHFRWKGTSPTTHCWVAEDEKDCPFMWYKILPVGSLD